MKILAFESSCDESALALFDSERGLELESVSTQIALHAQYGGVVPELAAREHLTNFPLILRESAEKILASAETINAVAVTRGPGLAGCLALGVSLARTVAICLGKPIFSVNHLRGHLFSPFISLHESDPASFEKNSKALFPHLGLVASGGNTLLVEVDEECHVKVLAQTVDDAAGEAFDKGAKLLGMPYPGGALIEENARLAKIHGKYQFPSGDAIKRDPRFSFSGLKTSLRYKLEKISDEELTVSLPEICFDYQDAIVRQLVNKTAVQFEKKYYASVGLSGGVSNNEVLRATFRDLADSQRVPLLLAKPKHTGDNAGMIAFAAWFDKQLSLSTTSISFEPSLPITTP